MASRIVVDGNAFYEIDEDCILCQKKEGRNGGPGEGAAHEEKGQNREQGLPWKRGRGAFRERQE